jgi:predicted acyltransferase
VAAEQYPISCYLAKDNSFYSPLTSLKSSIIIMDAKINSEITDQRLVCIDALRGFDMLWIIGGSEVLITLTQATGFKFLSNIHVHFDHSWGQFHFYDLIMPLFLFIVGVVMPVSFKKRLARGETKKKLYNHIIKRVIILYILGLIASGHILTFDISKIHLWTDTLHAIAFGYLISSIMILELRLKWQLLITSGLLLLYWGVMALIPVPGYGAGIYEPDTNLALYVDNAVLGHFQEGDGWTYIITNMTFVCSVMLGVFAGKILQSDRPQMRKVGMLALIGAGCIIVGKIWGIWFPIIHHLWTSTLVLYAGGLSYLLLSFFYLVIDVWGFKKWSFPFVVIGMNAIAVYVATHLFDFSKIGNVFVGGLAKYLGSWNDFVQALAALTVVWLILYWMYRKKTFIKI